MNEKKELKKRQNQQQTESMSHRATFLPQMEEHTGFPSFTVLPVDSYVSSSSLVMLSFGFFFRSLAKKVMVSVTFMLMTVADWACNRPAT